MGYDWKFSLFYYGMMLHFPGNRYHVASALRGGGNLEIRPPPHHHKPSMRPPPTTNHVSSVGIRPPPQTKHVVPPTTNHVTSVGWAGRYFGVYINIGGIRPLAQECAAGVLHCKGGVGNFGQGPGGEGGVVLHYDMMPHFPGLLPSNAPGKLTLTPCFWERRFVN